MAPNAAETLWSMLPDTSTWDLSVQTVMNSCKYVGASENEEVSSYLKPAQRLRLALEHLLNISELSEFESLLRSPYSKPSESLRLALDKATGSEGGESWDLLFEELRLAMLESAALTKTIEMVQSLLGSRHSVSACTPSSTTGNRTPRKLQELDSRSVSPRISNSSTTPRRNSERRSRLRMSHAPLGELNRTPSRRSSPAPSTNAYNEDEDAATKQEMESTIEVSTTPATTRSECFASYNPLQALLDEAEKSRSEWDSYVSSPASSSKMRDEIHDSDTPRKLIAETHVESKSAPLSSQETQAEVAAESSSETNANARTVTSPWPEWEVEADFAKRQKRADLRNDESVILSDDDDEDGIEQADDLEDSPRYDDLISRMSGIRASGHLLEVARLHRKSSQRPEEDEQRRLQAEIQQARVSRMQEEELERRRQHEQEKSRLLEQEEAENREIARRERQEMERLKREEDEQWERLRREEEERMREEMIKNTARRQAQARLRNSMQSLLESTDMKSNDCLQHGKELVKEMLAAARIDGLSGEDLSEALALERNLKKICVDNVLDECRGVDLNDPEALHAVKERLTNVISQALADGAHEKDLIEAETWRRRVHNRIEDLKGSIRVFCRIRPLSQKEREEGDAVAVRQVDSMTLEVEKHVARSRRSATPSHFATQRSRSTPRSSIASIERGRSGEREVQDIDVTLFRFDSVFAPASQREVFEDCRELMQSVFDGYNVTIFAYGQTGAGKTYTMSGPIERPGLTPQVLQEIYRIVEEDDCRFRHCITTSLVELYRNELVDLLQITQFAQPTKRASMRKDKEGSVHFENVVEEECPDAESLAEIIERGNMFRKTAATAMNSESSRSHLIHTVRIARTNRQTGETLIGKLLLVDLAGSERLKKSMVTGDVQKDSIEINKSLTALGDVIEALTQGQSAIPYRNHKLTQVLQDALGQSAKTLMFVHCSPARSNLEETLATLKYATRAKKIKRSTTSRGNITPRGGSQPCRT